MKHQAKAALFRETNRVVVETITVQGPRAGEVTVKLGACGVCHSDLSAVNGTIPFPPPVVLGHEGAGTIVEAGEGVTDFAVGDTVLASFVSMCGTCRYCTTGRPALCDMAAKSHAEHCPTARCARTMPHGKPLSIFSGCGVMAEYATLHHRQRREGRRHGREDGVLRAGELRRHDRLGRRGQHGPGHAGLGLRGLRRRRRGPERRSRAAR
jgi:Zn-dependent alcohol dehydrogenase